MRDGGEAEAEKWATFAGTPAGRFSGRDADAPFLIEGSYLDAAPADWVADWGDVTMTFHSERIPVYLRLRAVKP